MSDTPLIFVAPDSLPKTAVHCTLRRLAKGEQLPFHTHTDEAANHWTWVVQGALRWFGRLAIEGAIQRAGEIVDWKLGEGHGAEAIEDTSFFQILKRP